MLTLIYVNPDVLVHPVKVFDKAEIIATYRHSDTGRILTDCTRVATGSVRLAWCEVESPLRPSILGSAQVRHQR